VPLPDNVEVHDRDPGRWARAAQPMSSPSPHAGSRGAPASTAERRVARCASTCRTPSMTAPAASAATSAWDSVEPDGGLRDRRRVFGRVHEGQRGTSAGVGSRSLRPVPTRAPPGIASRSGAQKPGESWCASARQQQHAVLIPLPTRQRRTEAASPAGALRPRAVSSVSPAPPGRRADGDHHARPRPGAVPTFIVQ
jgi:hypothetical protein